MRLILHRRATGSAENRTEFALPRSFRINSLSQGIFSHSTSLFFSARKKNFFVRLSAFPIFPRHENLPRYTGWSVRRETLRFCDCVCVLACVCVCVRVYVRTAASERTQVCMPIRIALSRLSRLKYISFVDAGSLLVKSFYRLVKETENVRVAFWWIKREPKGARFTQRRSV